MRFVCDGLDLSDAVLKVIKAIGSRTTSTLLEGIKLEAHEDYVQLSATDLELFLSRKIPADVKIEGCTVVPGKLFADFVRKLTGEKIEIDLNEKQQMTIKYKDSEGVLQCMTAEDFPSVVGVNEENSFSIVNAELKDLIVKSSFSVATDDVRPILKGILCEFDDCEITAVALDGYRMSVVKKAVERNTGTRSIVVPARSLIEVGKMLDGSEDSIVTVLVDEKYIKVEIDHTILISRLLEGEFIRYKQIIPAEFFTTVYVEKKLLEDSLERASILSNTKNNLVKFAIKDKNMKVTSQSELGNIVENIPVMLNGKDIQIGFNARYFTEALKTVTDDNIRLYMTNNTSPMIIKPCNNEQYLFLILPVRIVA